LSLPPLSFLFSDPLFLSPYLRFLSRYVLFLLSWSSCSCAVSRHLCRHSCASFCAALDGTSSLFLVALPAWLRFLPTLLLLVSSSLLVPHTLFCPDCGSWERGGRREKEREQKGTIYSIFLNYCLYSLAFYEYMYLNILCAIC